MKKPDDTKEIVKGVAIWAAIMTAAYFILHEGSLSKLIGSVF